MFSFCLAAAWLLAAMASNSPGELAVMLFCSLMWFVVGVVDLPRPESGSDVVGGGAGPGEQWWVLRDGRRVPR